MSTRVRTENDLLLALRARKERIGMSNLELDERAGYSSGYSGRVLPIPPAKRMSITTALNYTQALALRVDLSDDPEEEARIMARRNAGAVTPNGVTSARRKLREYGRVGGIRSGASRRAKASARAR